jgi:hypothetical protein
MNVFFSLIPTQASLLFVVNPRYLNSATFLNNLLCVVILQLPKDYHLVKAHALGGEACEI